MINKRINKDPFKVISIILLILFGISIYIMLNNKDENNVVLSNKVKCTSQEDKKIVVIDMGHGGNDVRAQSIDGETSEKDISLEIGLKVTEIIGENSNIEVLNTRDTDEYLSLSDRIEFCNDNNADIFVSLHCNADPNGTSSTNGVETFYWKNDTDESYDLANSIQSSIINSLDVRDR
ncbi:N-acetylmuramoyl-L-alanine amidase LytC precursor [uncultured Clostridium sp.]|nr:N-acetylmuramoyl-L-alanine amidase LytC precursor [uncultured Clostridium sp.]